MVFLHESQMPLDEEALSTQFNSSSIEHKLFLLLKLLLENSNISKLTLPPIVEVLLSLLLRPY
jgi:hypothetical protein